LDWSNERNLKYFKKYVIDLNDTAFAIKKAKPDKYNLIGAYNFYAGPVYADKNYYQPFV
jgi:hypothetical protein